MYSFKGVIARGRGWGGGLGFPTANVLPDGDFACPADGVYVAEVKLAGEAEWRYAVLNQGMRPTLPGGERAFEAHVLGFNGDIYGVEIEVRYLRYLRGEVKFASAGDLSSQIAKDISSARDWIAAREAGE